MKIRINVYVFLRVDVRVCVCGEGFEFDPALPNGRRGGTKSERTNCHLMFVCMVVAIADS